MDHSEPTLIGSAASKSNNTDDPSLERTGLSPAVSPDMAHWAGTSEQTPRWVVAVAALVFLGIGGGAGWYFLAGPGASSGTIEVGATSAGAGDLAADPAGSPGAAEVTGAVDDGTASGTSEVTADPAERVEAETVTLTINSGPQGAAVLDAEGNELGKTPMSLSRSVDVGVFTLTLRLEGHLDASLSVDPSKGTEWTTTLAVVAPPTAPAPTAAETAHKKPAAKSTTGRAKRSSSKKKKEPAAAAAPAEKPPASDGKKSDGKKKAGEGYDDGGKRGFGTF